MSKDFVSLSEIPTAITSSFSAAEAAVSDENLDDACCICLEPFTTHNPATVTNCKHDYHLQCLLEWSQRSKECPICWRDLALKDPASQELLATVECERNSRTKHSVSFIHEDHEMDNDAPCFDESDFDGRIMRHFTALARRTRLLNRRESQRYSAVVPPELHPCGFTENVSGLQQTYTLVDLCDNSGEGLSDVDSSTSTPRNSVIHQTKLPVVPVVPSAAASNENGGRDAPFKSSQSASAGSQRPSSSDLFALSEALKSKFSAASAKYKESISRSTRGLKEKILSRNNSVKELSRGVQREMSAGIAGVTRMIGRLDLTSKRNGTAVSLSDCAEGSSNLSCKGKGIQENVIAISLNKSPGKTITSTSSDASTFLSETAPDRLQITTAQV